MTKIKERYIAWFEASAKAFLEGDALFHKVAALGRIHPVKTPVSAITLLAPAPLTSAFAI